MRILIRKPDYEQRGSMVEYRDGSWADLAEYHIQRECIHTSGVAESAQSTADACGKLIGGLIELLVESGSVTARDAFKLLQANHYDFGDAPGYKLLEDDA